MLPLLCLSSGRSCNINSAGAICLDILKDNCQTQNGMSDGACWSDRSVPALTLRCGCAVLARRVPCVDDLEGPSIHLLHVDRRQPEGSAGGIHRAAIHV